MEYQDALAALGVGSAHPGGLDSTYEWIHEIPWRPKMNVLDIGCGTGRTLLHIQKQTGCNAFGVDIRTKMIEKAMQRTAVNKQRAEWKVGSAENLPFPSGQFDVVYTESVNVFVDTERAFSEYYRVLKPGGWYVDVEMLTAGPVSDEWRESVLQVYGAKMVPDQSGWKKRYRHAGFSDIRVMSTKPVLPDEMMSTESKYPDDVDLTDPLAYQNPRLVKVLRANSQWFEQNHRFLGYGIFLMRKGDPEA